MPGRLRFRIESARSVAQRQLERSATCRALFAPFDRDGLELLVAAEIVSAERTPHAHVCENDASTLVTEIGGRTIGVCRDSFERLDRYQAAARLLHEILHHAGMSERPHDPEGLWPYEITRLVKRACRL